MAQVYEIKKRMVGNFVGHGVYPEEWACGNFEGEQCVIIASVEGENREPTLEITELDKYLKTELEYNYDVKKELEDFYEDLREMSGFKEEDIVLARIIVDTLLEKEEVEGEMNDSPV